MISSSDEQRFWAKVNKTDGCWLWTGTRRGRRGGGYGVLLVGTGEEKRMRPAHRISWAIHFEAPPDDLLVCHHCDNPPCVRPDHLFLGTAFDNMRDAGRKGRICTIGKGRFTHCPRGHEFTPENTRINVKGHRLCRACVCLKRNERRARIKAGLCHAKR